MHCYLSSAEQKFVINNVYWFCTICLENVETGSRKNKKGVFFWFNINIRSRGVLLTKCQVGNQTPTLVAYQIKKIICIIDISFTS